MSNELERFAGENREEFDSAEVPAALWDRIEQQILPIKKKSPIIQMGWMKMAVVAAVIAAVSLITFKVMNNKTTEPTKGVTVRTTTTPDTNNHSSIVENNDTDTPAIQNIQSNDEQLASNNEEELQDKEIFHFTKLIEIKNQQVKSIQKEHPELYSQFATDINKLDSSYIALKLQLKTYPNKELLLKAMIQNLQLQIDLLNEQLDVIKKIKQSKKPSNEKKIQTM